MNETKGDTNYTRLDIITQYTSKDEETLRYCRLPAKSLGKDFLCNIKTLIKRRWNFRNLRDSQKEDRIKLKLGMETTFCVIFKSLNWGLAGIGKCFASGCWFNWWVLVLKVGDVDLKSEDGNEVLCWIGSLVNKSTREIFGKLYWVFMGFFKGTKKVASKRPNLIFSGTDFP